MKLVTPRKRKATAPSQRVIVEPRLLEPRIFYVWGSPGDIVRDYLQQRKRGVVDELLQTRIDGMLKDVVAGRDARTVFRLTRKKNRGEHKNLGRERAMCAEVIRLEAAGVSGAVDRVAEAFSVEPRTVQRAFKAWKKDLSSPPYMEMYLHNLRVRGHKV